MCGTCVGHVWEERKTTCLDLIDGMAPRRNPLGNPELEPVEQRPLVSAVYSVVDDVGGHRGMWRGPSLDPSLDPIPNPDTFLDNLQPSRDLQYLQEREKSRVPGLVWLTWLMVDVVVVVRRVCVFGRLLGRPGQIGCVGPGNREMRNKRGIGGTRSK